MIVVRCKTEEESRVSVTGVNDTGMFFFFFSSRRRHTRWNCDWSSDVCSSDLLPFGKEQLFRTAEPHFKVISESSGRLDYLETIKQWRKRFGEPSVKKTLMKARRSEERRVGKECRSRWSP